MRPRPFDYCRAETLDGALAALGEHGSDSAAPYAGGTELLLILKMRLAEYGRLIDLKRIPALKEIAAVSGGLAIGATATHREIAGDANARRIAPALAKLCGEIANPRVRAVGTIGGNLCFAEPNADPPVLLAAYGAELRLSGLRGARIVPAEAFIKAPLETDRAEDEILTRIDIASGMESLRFARHLNGHRSLVCAAAFAPPARGGAARVWLGGLAQRPIPLRTAEALASGDRTTIEGAALREGLQNDIAALDIAGDADASADYRRHIATVMAFRAIEASAAAAGREFRT